MTKLAIIAAAAVAGVLAAFAIAPDRAAAYSPDQLPSLGYSVTVINLTDGCRQWLAGYGNSAKTDLGSDCDSGFQARVDALVAATCPCAQPPTTATVPTPPPTTTTDPAPAPPTTTTGASPPPPPPSTTTVTTTVTTVSSTAIDDLTARVSTLEQQITTLTARVDKLVSGQTVTLASRSWRVVAAKNGRAVLVASVLRPGEKVKPRRTVLSAMLVPLLAKK